MRPVLLAGLSTLAACGSGTDVGWGDARLPDARVPRPFPTQWTVRIVAPTPGNAVLIPLGIEPTTTDVVGYTGPEAWSPVSRAVRVMDGNVTVYDAQVEGNYGFGWGATGRFTVGEHAWKPTIFGAEELLYVPPGYNSGSAHAVDDLGSVIVGSYADYDDPIPPNRTGPRPCAWRGSEFFELQTFDAAHDVGAAWAVDRAGGIAGALSSVDGTVAVRWASVTSSPMRIGPFAGATLAEARAINASGDTAGRVTIGTDSLAFHAPAAGAPVVLPALAGGYAESYDLDDAGHVVGTSSPGDGTAHAVIWVDGAIIDLNDQVVGLPSTVRHLSSAVGIDAYGGIAAEAVMTSGTGDEIRYLAILDPI